MLNKANTSSISQATSSHNKIIPHKFRIEENNRRKSPEPVPIFFKRKKAKDPKIDNDQLSSVKGPDNSHAFMNDAYLEYNKLLESLSVDSQENSTVIIPVSKNISVGTQSHNQHSNSQSHNQHSNSQLLNQYSNSQSHNQYSNSQSHNQHSNNQPLNQYPNNQSHNTQYLNKNHNQNNQHNNQGNKPIDNYYTASNDRPNNYSLDKVASNTSNILYDDEKCIDSIELIEDPIDQCSHQNVIHEQNNITICEDCGTELYEEISRDAEWRYFSNNDKGTDQSRVQYRKNPEKGIRYELEKLGFPPDISQKADELYMMVTDGETKRAETRKGIMFATVFEAYKILKRPCIPEEIQSKFPDLHRKDMSKGTSFYRLRCPREYFLYEDISAQHFIPQIMKMPQFNTKQEHIDCVIKLYNQINDKCHALNKANPQTAAKALVYYYFRRKGYMIPIKTYGLIIGLSDVMIMRLAGEISRMLGTSDVVNIM